MARPQLWLDCEGSGCPPVAAAWMGDDGMCAMCGTFQRVTDGRVTAHRRLDVLAMLDRGDYG